jgi:hypothetical protein
MKTKNQPHKEPRPSDPRPSEPSHGLGGFFSGLSDLVAFQAVEQFGHMALAPTV